MAIVAILVADSKGGLDAVAEKAGLVIVDATVRRTDRLSTFLGVGYEEAGEIDTAKSGWVGFARKKGD